MKKALLVLIALTLLFTTAVSARLGRMSEFEVWLDGFMDSQLKDHNIAGTTIAVVKKGKLFFYKGYGYADIANKRPVKAMTTRFRPGSCSKLFTWTAVMQLVEQGKLDLNTDINYYLKSFKIPDTFPRPITLRDLMTHTPGFEDSIILLFVPKYDDLASLEEYLITRRPERVWPAGIRPAYSNYGAALAGYIVQEVSGILFDDYIKENIFDPLGMNDSTFRQEQTPEMKVNMSQGYVFAKGKFNPKAFEYCNPGPAGSMTTTAMDMTKFMIAHLKDGKPLLRAATAKEMHKRQITFDPRQNGICLGFYEMNYNGKRIIGHGGDTVSFHSLMALLPDENVGIFVSYNSPGGAKARDELLHAFMDRYYPQRLPNIPAADPKLVKEAKKLDGTYLSNRRSYTTFEKALQLLTPPIKIKALADGTLSVHRLRMAQMEPNFFRDLYDKNTAVARQINGRYYFNNFFPCLYFEKQAWYESAAFHWSLLWFCILAFLSAVLIWPVLLIIDKSHHVKVEGSTIAIWLSVIASGLDLACLPLIYKNIQEAIYAPHSLDWILVIPIVAAVLAVGSLIYTILAWKNKYWSLIIRLHYTLVTLALAIFIWWLNYWNLLGFKY